MKLLFSVIKKFIVSMFILYGFNLVAVNFNLMIPINLCTSLVVLFLGIPGLFMLVLFNFIMLWGW